MSETAHSAIYRWPARKPFDYIKHEYFQAIADTRGVPILLPNFAEPAAVDEYLRMIDGLLLTGGGDLDPRHFGQRPHASLSALTASRDALEIRLVNLALKRHIPILAICRGHQVLNVALDGTLHQDLACIGHKTLVHRDPDQTGKISHRVRIEKGSKLYGIIGSASIITNSSHHQVVDKLGRGLTASAFAPDGIIEAIEHSAAKFVIGIQWHPEGIINRPHSRKLFAALVNASRHR